MAVDLLSLVFGLVFQALSSITQFGPASSAHAPANLQTVLNGYPTISSTATSKKVSTDATQYTSSRRNLLRGLQESQQSDDSSGDTKKSGDQKGTGPSGSGASDTTNDQGGERSTSEKGARGDAEESSAASGEAAG